MNKWWQSQNKYLPLTCFYFQQNQIIESLNSPLIFFKVTMKKPMYLIYQQVCIPAPKTPATTKSITYFDRGMFSSGLYLFPTLRTETQVPEAMDPSDTEF